MPPLVWPPPGVAWWPGPCRSLSPVITGEECRSVPTCWLSRDRSCTTAGLETSQSQEHLGSQGSWSIQSKPGPRQKRKTHSSLIFQIEESSASGGRRTQLLNKCPSYSPALARLKIEALSRTAHTVVECQPFWLRLRASVSWVGRLLIIRVPAVSSYSIFEPKR